MSRNAMNSCIEAVNQAEEWREKEREEAEPMSRVWFTYNDTLRTIRKQAEEIKRLQAQIKALKEQTK